MPKSYRSKPVRGVNDFANMREGETKEEYYSRNADSNSYYSTYHQLATKYGWSHEPEKELPSGLSRTSFGLSWNGMISDDVHLTVNNYGRSDGKLQVIISNLRTDHSVEAHIFVDEIDQFVRDNHG